VWENEFREEWCPENLRDRTSIVENLCPPIWVVSTIIIGLLIQECLQRALDLDKLLQELEWRNWTTIAQDTQKVECNLARYFD